MNFSAGYADIISLIINSISCFLNQGPVVENLTKLLANMTLKFLSWNVSNTLILFAEKNVSSFCKSYSHFCSKNINVFENIIATTVNNIVINELIKLTVLLTTGPWLSRSMYIAPDKRGIQIHIFYFKTTLWVFTRSASTRCVYLNTHHILYVFMEK